MRITKLIVSTSLVISGQYVGYGRAWYFKCSDTLFTIVALICLLSWLVLVFFVRRGLAEVRHATLLPPKWGGDYFRAEASWAAKVCGRAQFFMTVSCGLWALESFIQLMRSAQYVLHDYLPGIPAPVPVKDGQAVGLAMVVECAMLLQMVGWFQPQKPELQIEPKSSLRANRERQKGLQQQAETPSGMRKCGNWLHG